MPEQLTLFDPDPLLDKHQVAQRLNVGPRFVERLIAERRIPYVKVGRHVRVRLSAISSFLSSNTIAAGHDGLGPELDARISKRPRVP